jgi:uncharacterized membrane protein YfcA
MMLELITLPESMSWASFYSLVFLSCFTSFMTASAGIGGGMLMLAVLAQVLPIKAIIPVHGLVQLGSNMGRTLIMFSQVHWLYFFWFALGSIIGAIIGGQLVISLPIKVLQMLLGSFILFTVWGPSFINKRSGNPTLIIGGLVSTFLTMFVGATGPFVIAVLKSFGLSREGLVATSAAFLVLQHALKVLVFGLLGFAFHSYLPLITLMIASGFIGTMIGRQLLLKIDEAVFQKMLIVVLSVLALRLIIGAFFTA